MDLFQSMFIRLISLLLFLFICIMLIFIIPTLIIKIIRKRTAIGYFNKINRLPEVNISVLSSYQLNLYNSYLKQLHKYSILNIESNTITRNNNEYYVCLNNISHEIQTDFHFIEKFLIYTIKSGPRPVILDRLHQINSILNDTY